MSQKGFSLIELLVSVVIIGILASLSIALYSQYRERALISAAISDLKNFEVAFHAYLIDNDSFPNDTHITLPPGMADFIPAAAWAKTPLGGSYNWEGPDAYPYAGIAFFEPTAAASSFAILDNMIDDGNSSTGKFIVGTNGRYVYTID